MLIEYWHFLIYMCYLLMLPIPTKEHCWYLLRKLWCEFPITSETCSRGLPHRHATGIQLLIEVFLYISNKHISISWSQGIAPLGKNYFCYQVLYSLKRMYCKCDRASRQRRRFGSRWRSLSCSGSRRSSLSVNSGRDGSEPNNTGLTSGQRQELTSLLVPDKQY